MPNPFADLTSVSSSQFRPAPGRLLVRRDPAPEKTETGLYLAPKSESSRRFDVSPATVVAVGRPDVDAKGRPLNSDTIRPGDRVFVEKFCGHDLELADGKFVVVSLSEILVVVEPVGT